MPTHVNFFRIDALKAEAPTATTGASNSGVSDHKFKKKRNTVGNENITLIVGTPQQVTNNAIS